MNMKENEAIKEFKQNIDMPFGSNISREASGLAIQALEKQIPKKPMISYDERVKENWCSCSVCAFGFGWKRTIHYKYCPDCSQKIDWSEE